MNMMKEGRSVTGDPQNPFQRGALLLLLLLFLFVFCLFCFVVVVFCCLFVFVPVFLFFVSFVVVVVLFVCLFFGLFSFSFLKVSPTCVVYRAYRGDPVTVLLCHNLNGKNLHASYIASLISKVDMKQRGSPDLS